MARPALLAGLWEDHDNARRLLDLLAAEAAAIADGDDADYDVVEGVIDYLRGYPDSYHHPVEDRVLERVNRLSPGAVGALDDLAGQHVRLRETVESAARDLDNMRLEAEMPRSRVVARIDALVAAYRHHMDSEEGAFFPVAEASLKDADWAAIAEDMAAEIDPLFAGREGFVGLRKRLLAAGQNR